MGTSNSKLTNKVGKKVVKQKLEYASKTGVLSLTEHHLENIPSEVYSLMKLRTLDVSNNEIRLIPSQLSALSILKSFNCDDNSLSAGSLHVLSKLEKLQILSANRNQLGKVITKKSKNDSSRRNTTTTKEKHLQNNATNVIEILPSNMPPVLKQVSLSSNYLCSIPKQLLSLPKLEKLDLSDNNIASVPPEIMALVNLTELNLDANSIVSLPKEIGHLTKLKTLSLRNNHISVIHSAMKFSEDKNPQPLPSSLFTNTPIIDLNLHGNPMTNTQLNLFEGFQSFLERRQKNQI
jgi:Leucine-rich repeat (LRR) protein